MTTPAVTPQVQGLPPGAYVTPIGGAPPQQAQGLPPGAYITPLGQQSDLDTPDTQQQPAQPQSAMSGITNFMNDVYTGVTHGIAKTAQGISHLTGAPEIPQAAASAAEPNANPEQGGGEMMENMLEFLMGDEALKGLSYADKLKKVVPILKATEGNGTLAKALTTAMRTGTVSAGQAAVKGGSPSDIATQGLVGGVVGGATEGLAGKLTGKIAEASPEVSNVGGETMVTPKPAQVPPEVQATQTAGKNVIARSAAEAAQRNVITDVPGAISKAQSFGDAADEVEKSAKGAYGRLNEATGGKFSQTRDEFNAARKDVWNAIGPTERDAAQARLDNATAKMQGLFADADGKVTQQDWTDANSAWNNAKTLHQVHQAVESTFDTDAGFSQRSGTYRGFNGNQLRQNLNRLTQKIGEPELNRVIGRDNMDNLRKVAELTRTNADRAKFGAAVQKVGGWLARDSAAAAGGALLGHVTGIGGLGGAVTGEAAYMAARKVMQMVATNPRVGQQLTFAVEAGARPEYYAPLIGKMIRDAEDEGKAPPMEDEPERAAPAKPSGQSFDIGPKAGQPIPGMIQKGNVDVNHRPSITNEDGSHSSIFSMTVPVDQNGDVWKGSYESAPRYALVPSIANGRFLTPNGKIPVKGDSKGLEALEKKSTDYYDKTREHLGIFASEKAANDYAEKTHAYMNDGTARKVYAPSYEQDNQ